MTQEIDNKDLYDFYYHFKKLYKLIKNPIVNFKEILLVLQVLRLLYEKMFCPLIRGQLSNLYDQNEIRGL
jgi:hypothetical protein